MRLSRTLSKTGDKIVYTPYSFGIHHTVQYVVAYPPQVEQPGLMLRLI
jgi:hypothetical protein